MSNGAFILNLDCDHYVYNSQAMREGMCFMLDRGGDRLCYVQFPQRFEGIDPSDRYANHNTVFFDVNMRALDGLQGPVYVGTGCLFRRTALYGFDPPPRSSSLRRRRHGRVVADDDEAGSENEKEGSLLMLERRLLPKKFGNSVYFAESIAVAEFQGRPLADHPTVKNGRAAGALTGPREPLDAAAVAEAVAVVSCWYEDKTEWGRRVGGVDLRLRHRGRAHRLPHAQPRVEVRLLRHPPRRLPRHRPDQPHRPPPPGAPLGHRLRRDLLLPQQRPLLRQEHEAPAADRVPQRRNLPLHLRLPRRLLLPPRPLPLLRPIHRPDIERHVPLLPSHHHPHALPAGGVGGQVVRDRAGGVVAERAVLADRRDGEKKNNHEYI